jgi:S-adenosyl-L-methionine hydrolase (adenosine-forming)
VLKNSQARRPTGALPRTGAVLDALSWQAGAARAASAIARAGRARAPWQSLKRTRIAVRSLAAACLLGLSCALVATRADPAPRVHVSPATRPLIVFMTDFGTVDDAVAICKGVMLSIAPDAEIIDLTHQVKPYSITDGARLLARTARYYPAGTVFVSVVDPGVGTVRRSIVVKSRRGQFFVLPDNGLVTPVADRDGIVAAREIRNADWLLPGSSSTTFHGRDVYSPVAAHLARGEDWTGVGPTVGELVRLETPRAISDTRGIAGSVVALDGPFGNLVTNISAEEFRALGFRLGESVRFTLAGAEASAPYATTFGDVRPGEALLFIDSRGVLSLALNQGNFAESRGIVPPVDLFIHRK